ncbi:hypothetical protein B0O95_1164 [Mycetohabitans endofungorum]|uniref:YNCE-like beta-propeller domain-containing protein n=1 Tax=Mycetohabitans endofungorum TaxID=417203 RepID=A0A2P5K787_9BURK|nr:hypothetical protein B0O95_1164 [Mycetohabitans endofungorum]
MLNSNHFVRARRVAGSLAAARVCVALAPLAVANNVIVLNSGEATLSLIDQASRQVVGTVPTGKEPHYLMPTPDNTSLILAVMPSHVAFSNDSRTAFVTLQVSGRLMSPTLHTARIAPPWPTPRLCQ